MSALRIFISTAYTDWGQITRIFILRLQEFFAQNVMTTFKRNFCEEITCRDVARNVSTTQTQRINSGAFINAETLRSTSLYAMHRLQIYSARRRTPCVSTIAMHSDAIKSQPSKNQTNHSSDCASQTGTLLMRTEGLFLQTSTRLCSQGLYMEVLKLLFWGREGLYIIYSIIKTKKGSIKFQYYEKNYY